MRRPAETGLPIFGTCAGAILHGKGSRRDPTAYELVDVEVRRNAYGRQVDSFSADLFLTPFETSFSRCLHPRADHRRSRHENVSRVRCLENTVEIPVLLRSGRMLLATFHPELTDDLRVHKILPANLRESKETLKGRPETSVRRSEALRTETAC